MGKRYLVGHIRISDEFSLGASMPLTRSGNSLSDVYSTRWVRIVLLAVVLPLERYVRCNCVFLNLRFVTSIRRRKTGKPVKTFRLVGITYFERVLLWTWRDLFVSMLASNPGQKHAIPDMLQDIRANLGWKSLPKMLFGGQMSQFALFRFCSPSLIKTEIRPAVFLKTN